MEFSFISYLNKDGFKEKITKEREENRKECGVRSKGRSKRGKEIVMKCCISGKNQLNYEKVVLYLILYNNGFKKRG